MNLSLTPKFSKLVLAALAACLLCSAVPALAAATTFQVDSSGDQPDSTPGDGVCQTAVATCTLRAAIEEADAEDSADVVDFAAAFDGGAGSTIAPATALPAITEPLTIDGVSAGRCAGASGFPGPCVGLLAPVGERGLFVDAADVTIEGLAISGATTGVEIGDGADRATVAGNWIGRALDGTLAENEIGIWVDNASDVTIGGASSQGANRINGGSTGIGWGTAAPKLAIEGNLIGLNLARNGLFAPPSAFGIYGDASGEGGGFESAQITANQIAMLGGEAIRQHGSGADIIGNTIGETAAGGALSGGETAIHLEGQGSFAAIVEGNTIANAGRYGLLIENRHNRVMGNHISTAGVNGIRILATNNLIGEDAPSTENTISGSGAAAIVIIDAPISGNIVARVSGTGNGGLFIDRGGDGPGNSGENVPIELKGSGYWAIAAPRIEAVSTTGASGTVNVEEALIRVYAKSTASPGELGKMIAETFSRGDWEVSYPAQPPGSYIAVTASIHLYGTSELAISSTDRRSPRARIVSGPRGRTSKRWAKFRFRSNKAGSTFVCQLDRTRWRPCRSPRIYRHLKPGFHVFRVQAKDASGNGRAQPAVRNFTVITHRH